jgi:predicted CXXCH cytochrome family protein
MNVLISYLTRKSTGDTVHRDDEKSAETLRLGRATDSEVYLADPRILLSHAAIHSRPAGFFIESVGSASLIVNEQVTNSARIGVGDRMRVGPYEVAVVQAPAGKDLAITVEVVEPFGNALAELEKRSRTSLAEAGFSKRTWSWLLMILVLGLFLGLPVAGFYVPDLRAASKKYFAFASDKAWDSGEISTPHKFFGDNCNACHTEPFRQVKDAACLTCHAGVPHHVDVGKFQMAKLDEASCESCHKEHNGPKPITLRAQSFCSDCHSGLKQTASATTLNNVADFASHPQLRPTMIVDPVAKKWERVSMDAIGFSVQKLPSIYASLKDIPTDLKQDVVCADRTQVEDPRLDQVPAEFTQKPRERSGLRFTHCTHLSLDKYCTVNPQTKKVECKGPARAPGQEEVFSASAFRPLTCASCHQAEPGGALMKPIRFEEHCSTCHQLKIAVEYGLQGRPDSRKWVRNLPHGKPKEVQEIIKDFYGWLALQPITIEADPSIMPRSRPGRLMTEEDRTDARRWARQKADQMTDAVIAKTSCGDCHKIERGADPREWDVLGATLAYRWFPKSTFDHKKHASTQCTECHVAARVSNSASDVLLPGIDNCQTCHGGEGAANKVPSTCVDCHYFHIPGMPGMRDAKPGTPGKSASLFGGLPHALGRKVEVR